jgi:UDP-glucuronate decarboxylase
MPKKQVITKSALVPTILISGGAGFIGSHLAEALLENNARVIVLDNFQTGKKIHVKELLANKNFALYDVDVNEGIPPEIESVDYIFHLAGVEEYLYSKEYLNLESLFTNSLGTKNLLDLAKRSSAKFLLVSTIDVYQGRMSQLYLDKYFGITPSEENKFSLIEAKRFAEAVVWEYFKTHGVDVRIVRIPEVYGPRMDLSSSGFIGGFIKNVLDGSSIEIFGEGTEKEHYLYVSDTVSGLVKAQFNARTKGNIYSLVPEEPISALEAAYMVKSLADAKLSVQFKPGITDFKQQLRSPDTFNLKDLNWKPKVGIKEGVVRTLEAFGYSVNTHAFKPIKLVEEKIKENTNIAKEKVISLQGIINNKEEVVTDKKPNKSLDFFKRREEAPIKVLRKEIKNGVTKIGRRNVTSDFVNRFKFSRYRLRGNFGYLSSVTAVIVAAALVFIALPSLGLLFNSQKALASI